VSAIDIIIPFHNQPELLFACLSSLGPSASPESRLILVDDASSDESISRIEHRCHALPMPFEYHRHETNQGFIGSIHTGLAAAQARTIILLNSDTIVTPHFDVRLAEALAAHPEIKAAAPVTNAATDLYQYRPACNMGTAQGGALYGAIARAAAQTATQHYGEVTEVPFLTGACLALDRDAFERAGGFSQDYSHGYFEDLDLCCRFRQQGARLVIREDCFVYHRGQGTYRQTDRAEHARRMEHNFTLFRSRWGHMPEHDELVARLSALSMQP